MIVVDSRKCRLGDIQICPVTPHNGGSGGGPRLFESSFCMFRNYRTIIDGHKAKLSCIKLQDYSPLNEYVISYASVKLKTAGVVCIVLLIAI